MPAVLLSVVSVASILNETGELVSAADGNEEEEKVPVVSNIRVVASDSTKNFKLNGFPFNK